MTSPTAKPSPERAIKCFFADKPELSPIRTLPLPAETRMPDNPCALLTSSMTERTEPAAEEFPAAKPSTSCSSSTSKASLALRSSPSAP